MPVLIYGKAEFRPAGWDDFIEETTPDELPPGLDRNETAMQLIVRKLCRPGQTVCDPVILDRAGAALAARGWAAPSLARPDGPLQRQDPGPSEVDPVSWAGSRRNSARVRPLN